MAMSPYSRLVVALQVRQVERVLHVVAEHDRRAGRQVRVRQMQREL
jgi:hypothetical protein